MGQPTTKHRCMLCWRRKEFSSRITEQSSLPEPCAADGNATKSTINKPGISRFVIIEHLLSGPKKAFERRTQHRSEVDPNSLTSACKRTDCRGARLHKL